MGLFRYFSGSAKLGVIGDVERFDSQLDRAALAQAKLAAHGQVRLPHAEAPDGVAPQVSLDARRGHGECLRVQPAPPGVAGSAIHTGWFASKLGRKALVTGIPMY